MPRGLYTEINSLFNFGVCTFIVIEFKNLNFYMISKLFEK